jgi:hypothetical protein
VSVPEQVSYGVAVNASKFPSANFRGSVASTLYRAQTQQMRPINSMGTLNGAVSGASSRALCSAARRTHSSAAKRRRYDGDGHACSRRVLQRRTARPDPVSVADAGFQRRLRYGDGSENDGD